MMISFIGLFLPQVHGSLSLKEVYNLGPKPMVINGVTGPPANGLLNG